MPATLKDADTLISEIIPSNEVKKLEYGRTEEILQPLLDLGYVIKADETLIAQGIRLFRKDYLSLDLIPGFTPNFLFLSHSELESEELNLLHTLTALEGDFTIDTLPNFGDVNLITRIIHYRLSIHHLFVLPVDHPFSQGSLDAIKILRAWIRNLPKDDIKMLNKLGNIPELIQHINVNKNGKLNERIVAFEYHKADTASEFQVAIDDDMMREVEEDEQESDVDNEVAMDLLESQIEQQLDSLAQEPIFDKKEQDALKDSRRNRRKRSKMVRIRAMLKKISEEQQKVNIDINNQRNAVKDKMAPLVVLQTQFNDQQKSLNKNISQKEQTKNDLKKSQKGLKRGQKWLKKKKKRLRKKIKNKKPQQEIDALKKQIDNFEKSLKKIENLDIEISALKVKLFPIEDQLKRINRNIKSFNNQLIKLNVKRARLNKEKQTELKPLSDRLIELEGQVNKIKYSFKGKLSGVLDKNYYDNIVKPTIFEARNRDELRTISLMPYNNYLIRLIQIFQWTNGFYYGTLDSQIGNRTFSALDDMVTYSKDLKLKFILSRLSENFSGTKGYWILNIKYLFQKLSVIITKQDKEVTTQNLLEKYETLFNKDNPNATKIGNEVTDKGYKDIVTENKQDLKEGGFIRRIYYGIKGIATTLFNALDGLVRLIKKGIKKLIYLVKNLIKIVYREIREGVLKFRDGMKFLFGKRQFATVTAKGSAILTKFDFDFDAITFTPPDVNSHELKQHADGLYRYSNNLEFSLVLTAKILKWAFTITSLGWGRLAIKIAIEYKRMIIKWLVSLGRNLRRKIISIKYKVKPEAT